MPEQQVTAAEFEAAKGDPALMPSIGGTAPGEVDPEGVITDIRPTWTLGGLQARPFSAGVIGVLEHINHPALNQDEGDTDPPEMSLRDVISLLYILTCPNVGDLVDQADDGTLGKESLKWSFTLNAEDLEAAKLDADKWLVEAGKVMAGVDTGPDDAQKKIG